ncbi:hypothetical protein B7Y94_06020 [Candidatus Saccharibacteria bacterium 32-49-12]|nr:MAG: hypothetical protein B7Y94_06020 [Candidatus Saccharibacteria bacterium 32-49-12]
MAAITIVAYNGVTARANTTSAQSAAATVIKKIEVYNAEESQYPATVGALTGAAQSKSYNLTGVTPVFAAITAQPTSPNTVAVYRCPATGTIGGMQVEYWKYDGTPGAQKLSTGVTTSCSATPLAS